MQGRCKNSKNFTFVLVSLNCFNRESGWHTFWRLMEICWRQVQIRPQERVRYKQTWMFWFFWLKRLYAPPEGWWQHVKGRSWPVHASKGEAETKIWKLIMVFLSCILSRKDGAYRLKIDGNSYDSIQYMWSRSRTSVVYFIGLSELYQQGKRKHTRWIYWDLFKSGQDLTKTASSTCKPIARRQQIG